MSHPLKKQRALEAIENAGLLEKLKDFSPVVVSTILVGLDVEDSDIDVVCCYSNPQIFFSLIKKCFSGEKNFFCEIRDDHVIARFIHGDFLFEIYASTMPVARQLAYRHFIIMQRIVALGGDSIGEAIRELKQKGFKTEPAIASLLRLDGSPYQAVLGLENWSDSRIKSKLSNVLEERLR